MKDSRLLKQSRLYLIIVSAVCIAFALASTAFAEEPAEYIDCDGDYTDFSMEVSELVSEEDVSGPADDSMDRRLLVVTSEPLDMSGLPGEYNVIASGEGLYVLQFSDAADAAAAYDQLKGNESVESIEFDSVVETTSMDGSKSTIGSKSEGSENSGHLSWGADVIDVDEYAERIGQTGNRVTVAVVDTGVDSQHSFLSSRIVEGYDFVEYDAVPQDENGHGTHVSGTIVDCTQDVEGIDIMPIRVLDGEGEGDVATVSSGLLYACVSGASVINLSLGGAHTAYFDAIINRVLSTDIAIVAAAGNEGCDINKNEVCPAHIDEVITVGAVDSRLNVASFSNYGKALDVVAPGVSIRSSIPNNKYTRYSGTSMATPHVSACVALMELKYGHLSNSQIHSLIKRACTSYDDVDHYGNGIIDLKNLIESISDCNVEVMTNKYVYSGKARMPSLKVVHNGRTLIRDRDYTVSYHNNTNVGTATAVVEGKGIYIGRKTVSFTIIPKGTTITKIKAKKKSLKVRWKKQAAQTSGYQIQYSPKKTFKSAKTITIKTNRITKKTVLKLKKNKRYFMRIRTYKTVGDKKYYSNWSRTYYARPR